jgi:hypothetical protein
VKRFLGRWSADERDGGADPESDVAELLESYAARRYAARPVRPWMLVASRLGLWAAVGVGAIGGLVGLLSGGDGEAEAVAEAPPDPAIVPAQVASVAEMVVREWLVATQADEDRMAELFVEPPELPRGVGGRRIRHVQTVTGQLVQPGYWTVVAAADLTRPATTTTTEIGLGDGQDGHGGQSGQDEQREEVTWFVEVGIVGDPRTTLTALRTPAIVPEPPPAEQGWASTTQRWQVPGPGDDLAQAVSGFLNALLAGEGDPGRYAASGVDISAVDPPPLQSVAIDQLAIEDLEDGRLRVQARVTGAVSEDQEQPLAYELVVRWRDDRYEVLQLWGSSTLAAQPDGS